MSSLKSYQTSMLYSELEYALDPIYTQLIEAAGNANAYRSYIGLCMSQIHSCLSLEADNAVLDDAILSIYQLAPWFN